MFYPIVQEDNNTLSQIETWYGYNHNLRIKYGQFYDSENLSSDYFPVLTSRKNRRLLEESDNFRGLLYSDGIVSWLEGTTLHYYMDDIDLSDYMGEDLTSEQTLLRFGSYILIFPLGIYVNVYDSSDIGTIAEKFKAETGITVTYSMCTYEGDSYDNMTVSDTAPANPKEGDYWLCTEESSKGLNVWSKDSWKPVATTYIRITVPGAELPFSVGDTVSMNTILDDVNEGSTIQNMGDDFIVILGLLDEQQVTQRTSEAWTLTIERKMPVLDYVCCDKNRVWGCHYGYSEDKFVNEIYASKLGDFKNWYTYTGLADDSYALSIGVPGEWTGCISYNGYPTFFKENAVFQIYGNYPAQYSLITHNCRGVQEGSYKSLVAINEYLIYKSPSDICIYDGSSPTSISEALGRDTHFYNAVAGGCGNKYYIQMENKAGTEYFFVYDMEYGIWEKEDAPGYIRFSNECNGQMFAITDTELHGYGTTDNYLYSDELVGEEYPMWFAESGPMGLDYPDYKYVSKLTIRYYMPTTGDMSILIAYDDRPYEVAATIRGGGSVESQSFSFSPYRCDHFKLKLEGHGDARIYSMAIKFEAGSEDDNGFD